MDDLDNGPADTPSKDADPGAQSPPSDAPKNGPAAPAGGSALSNAERAELDKLRAIHADESKWEKRNKANLGKLRELAQSMGIDRSEFNPADFNPQQAFDQLRAEVESERTERRRIEVARALDVEPQFILGKTEDEMTASGEAYKAAVKAAVDAALAAKTPDKDAGRITAADAKGTTPVGGPKQLTAADLDGMSNTEILKAKSEGRLNVLLGIK